MRSLARDFSSSRRAPPKAASKPYLSSACFSASVFMIWVCSAEPWSKGLTPLGDAVRIDVDDEIEAELLRRLVAEVDHLAELPGGVDMHQREGRLRRIEGLHGEMQHDGRILADRIEHHRLFAFGRHLADDVDRFRLQPGKMGQVPARGAGAGRFDPVEGAWARFTRGHCAHPSAHPVHGAGRRRAALAQVEDKEGSPSACLPSVVGSIFDSARKSSMSVRNVCAIVSMSGQ